MRINDKEINFAYTVGAYCDICDYVAANPDVSTATAQMYKAVFMSKAYAEANGGETVTIEELRALPFPAYQDVLNEATKAEAEGTKRTVETVSKKKDTK